MLIGVACDPMFCSNWGFRAITGTWGGAASQSVRLPAGETCVNVTVAAKGPKLWWARGMGPPHMYNITAMFTPAAGVTGSRPSPPVQTTRRIGFRYSGLGLFWLHNDVAWLEFGQIPRCGPSPLSPAFTSITCSL